MNDHRRRSFLGLVASNMGMQPYSRVMGTFLALLVASRTTSAVAITFALTAYRYVGLVTFPLAGRLSDRTTGRWGRRVPYMVTSLAVTGVAVWLLTVVPGYWGLAVLILIARQAFVFNAVARVAAYADVFGRSRWAMALVSVTAVAILPNLLILGVIRYTWDQDDPSSWDITFKVAACGLFVAAAAVAIFVREAPAARAAAAAAARRSWREELADLLALPNARPFLATAILLAAAAAATERIYAVWALERLGAGGDDLAAATVAMAVGAAALLPLGVWWGGRVHPRRMAVWACAYGGAVTLAHVFIGEIWMTVAAVWVTTPTTVAAVVAIIPLLLRLIPRSDNVGESYGFLAGPLLAGTSVAAFLSAATVDVFGDYRLMWLWAGGFVLAAGVALAFIDVPRGMERADLRDLMRRGRGTLWGTSPQAKLFGGTVAAEDVLGREMPAPSEEMALQDEVPFPRKQTDDPRSC